VVLVPATTALYRLAPPASWPATPSTSRSSKSSTKPSEGPADAGRLQPCEPGGEPRRIRGARRADRPVPHGLAGALPRGPVRRRDRQHPHLRPRQPAQPVPGARGAPAARPRVPDGRRARAPSSAAAGASCWRATRPRAASTRTWATGVATAGIEYYLPLFFDDTATVFDYLGDEATVVLHGDLEPPSSASGRTRASATAWCRATPSARCCRPRRCS
jgi:transcription-repair coupling factor (superfamily II helicase)